MVYYKRVQLRTARWRRCTGLNVWEGAQSFHTISGYCTLLAPQGVHPPSGSLILLVRNFMEVSLHRSDWLNYWSLMTELRLQPLSPPWGWAWGSAETSDPLITWLLLLGNQPPSLGTSQKVLLLPLTLELFQEPRTESKYYNKRCFNGSYHSGNYQGFRNSLLGIG